MYIAYIDKKDIAIIAVEAMFITRYPTKIANNMPIVIVIPLFTFFIKLL